MFGISTMLMGCGQLSGPPGSDGAQGAPGQRGMQGIPGEQQVRGGTRIKARYFFTSGGTRGYTGWYDSKIEYNCIFAKAVDGQMRCLPDGILSSVPHLVFYDNSGCSGDAVAVGVVQNALSCTPIGSYVADKQRVPCDASEQVYSVGTKYDGDDPIYYSDGGACLVNFSYKLDFFKIVPVSPDFFESAHESTE